MTRYLCSFYAREATVDGIEYDPITVRSPEADGLLRLPQPPTLGDLMSLTDATGRLTGVYEIVLRTWMYPTYGSRYWPYDAREPTEVPVTVIVERALGPFRDEVERPGDDTG